MSPKPAWINDLHDMYLKVGVFNGYPAYRSVERQLERLSGGMLAKK